MSILAQRSLAGGEISPALYSRTDLSKYQSGLRTCRNAVVMRHGGAQNRAGLKYLAEVKNSAQTARLIPFVFNDSQTYVLEFGNQYVRFYKAGVRLSVSGVAAYNGATAYTVNDLVSSAGVNYYCIAATTGNAPPNATYWYALTGSIYEIPTPYVAADLAAINLVQSADVITLVHPSYAPRELQRYGDTEWTLATISFAPTQAAPTAPSVTSPAAGTGSNYGYKVTAVSSTTGEESLPTADFSTTNTGTVTTTAGNQLGWTVAAGAGWYNIYSRTPNLDGGVYAYIGSSESNTFAHVAQTPDFTRTPPVANNPFGSTDNYPSVVGYYQQRRLFAATNNDPEKIWASRTGLHTNFTATQPVQDDNAVSFSLVGRFVNQVKQLLDLGKLVVFTSGGEWTVNGDGAGVLTPFSINARQASYNGCSELQPLIIGNTALYNQARGTIVLDLAFDYQVDSYRGNDLGVFAGHLFRGHTISDWAYAQNPDSVLWAVRDDGVMLGLTYVREHQVWAWHRHDTDGTFENVCVVPEGEEDVLYCVVKRTIDGATVRYVERMQTRFITDIEDAIFIDAALSYDGTQVGSVSMTLSGGSTWARGESLTLTASAGTFTDGTGTSRTTFEVGDVGNEIHITYAGTVYRCEITAYTSATVVTVRVNRAVPVGLQGSAKTTWGKAVDELTGLDHLEGEEVSVFADGFVVANPNNQTYPTLTVSSGALTLAAPYVVIHVGLPYTTDIQTLDIDTVQGRPLVDKKKLVTNVVLNVEGTRGLWAGSYEPTDDTVGADPSPLYEYKPERSDYESPAELMTEPIEIPTTGEWNGNGRVFIRQSDPVPMTILSINPGGVLPVGG